MTIECTNCHARYTIADSLVPPQGARVRCRKCGEVIQVKSSAPMVTPSELPLVPPSPESSSPESSRSEPGAPLFPTASEPPVPAAEPPPRITASTIPDGLTPEQMQRHEKARRLARVLASDIAIYNREKRERGIREGNLVAVLGYEIKKSWETYKERVGADFANSTPYF